MVVRAGPVSAAILSSAGMTPIITSNQAGLVTGLPLYITMSRGHEGCHAARVTAAGGNRQHTTTSEFGSFGYHSDHFHLSVNIVTFSPVFVIPSCSCVRVDTWGEQHPHLGTRHDYSGVDSDYGTQTLSPLLETA